MLIKGFKDEDFVNYKKPSMFIGFPYCTFKCDKECGKQVCQNSALANSQGIEISIISLIDRYMNNPITEAIVCGGLEPFDTYQQLLEFITELKKLPEFNEFKIFFLYESIDIDLEREAQKLNITCMKYPSHINKLITKIESL